LKYFLVAVISLSVAFSAVVWAQSPRATGTLRGQVVDPSGAVVPNAAVVVLDGGGTTHSVNSSHTGGYEIGNLPAGKYTVTANAQGFAVFVQDDVNVPAGQVTQFNISLQINVEQEKVNVEGVSPQVDVNPANNANAIILTGKDLEALPDDPDELQSDLEALAGPSAGPNGGQIYIDGFTGGQLPPKASIREIRINQNPFSAEYDKLGYGRIEIFTKPGTDKFHGQVSVLGNSSAFNTRNPFLGDAEQPPYDTVIFMGNIGGPINKKASFFFDIQHRNINEIAIVNAFLPPIVNDVGTPYSASVPDPRTRTNLSPRIDYQLTPNNTLTLRYQYYHDTQQNAGIGGFDLNAVNTPDFTSPSSGYNTASSENTLQLTDTQTIGAKAVNETRFAYERDTSEQYALSSAPSISVQGNFVGGGSSSGTESDHTDHYEVQNYTSLSLGKHFIKFGVRVRAIHDINASNAGFNGGFSFTDLQTYVNAEQGVPGAYPNQFSLGASANGIRSVVPVTMVDTGLYYQDDFKVRPTLTLSYGLRFETQTDIRDHADWAPRLGFSWGIDGRGKNPPKTVLRGGFGIFYDRFGENLILNADRYNGVNQELFTITSTPGCTTNCQSITFYPNIPAPNSLPKTSETVYQINPAVRTPYTMQTAFSLERQLTKISNLTVSYLHSRGVHQLVTVNANARLPGTPYSDGAFPFTGSGPIYQYISEAVFKQNQLIANFNVRAGARLSLFGYYALSYANSDTGASGAGGGAPTISSGTPLQSPNFPSDQYDISADYGRASFDIRHRIFGAGSISLPRNFRISPFLIFNSGMPYNVTVGQDLSGSSLLNARPAFATASTPPCTFPNPAACRFTIPSTTYTQIPINYLTGPNLFTLNLRVAKTFAFGRETSGNTGQGNGNRGGGGGGGRGGGGGFGRGPGGAMGGIFGPPTTSRRYNLTFSATARNVLNIVNPAIPIGTVTSSLFEHSNALASGPFSSGAANRKIELQLMFNF
jgi:Carboxypeptidase regulatory-like domain